MHQIDLDKLASEQALNDWYEIIRIKSELTVLRSAPSAEGSSASAAVLEARRKLVEQYQEIRKRQSAYERPQVRMGPTAFGPSGCGASLLRPKDIDRWRRVNPDAPGTHGTIRQTAVEQEYGLVEFDADLTKSVAVGSNDYSTWMLQWVYVYVFPAPVVKSRLHYTFRLWPNTWWFTETNNRRVVIMLHVGIEHVPSLGSVGGPLYDELWPVIIDTDRPEYGPDGYPSGFPIDVSGSFAVGVGKTPALALFPGVFVNVPKGLLELPRGSFWVSNEFPADTTDQDRWGWISYCMEPEDVVE